MASPLSSSLFFLSAEDYALLNWRASSALSWLFALPPLATASSTTTVSTIPNTTLPRFCFLSYDDSMIACSSSSSTLPSQKLPAQWRRVRRRWVRYAQQQQSSLVNDGALRDMRFSSSSTSQNIYNHAASTTAPNSARAATVGAALPVVVDPYQCLYVRRDANRAEIRQAYRRLALYHHPARRAAADNVGDGEGSSSSATATTFAVLAAAYETLADPIVRQRCNALLKQYEQQHPQAHPPSSPPLFPTADAPVSPNNSSHTARLHTVPSILLHDDADDQDGLDAENRGSVPDTNPASAPDLTEVSWTDSSSSSEDDNDALIPAASPTEEDEAAGTAVPIGPVAASSSTATTLAIARSRRACDDPTCRFVLDCARGGASSSISHDDSSAMLHPHHHSSLHDTTRLNTSLPADYHFPLPLASSSSAGLFWGESASSAENEEGRRRRAKKRNSPSLAEKHFTQTDTDRLFGGPLQLLFRARRWRPFTDPFVVFATVFGSPFGPATTPSPRRGQRGALPTTSHMVVTTSSSCQATSLASGTWGGSSPRTIHSGGSSSNTSRIHCGTAAPPTARRLADGSLLVTQTRVLPHDPTRVITRREHVWTDPVTGQRRSTVTVTSEDASSSSLVALPPSHESDNSQPTPSSPCGDDDSWPWVTCHWDSSTFWCGDLWPCRDDPWCV